MSSTAQLPRQPSDNAFLVAAAEWQQADDAGEFATPGKLARWLDPLTVQTPALNVVDRELVAIRDRIAVMFRRREIFAELVSDEDGEDETAIQQAVTAAESAVPDAGNGRLILSMPPQEGKTERVGRRGVLWLLQQFPDLRVGLVSYDGDHAGRISYLARSDIELFDGTDGTRDLGLKLARNQKAVSRWLLAPPATGGVYAIGIGGGLTGRPLDLLLIDDPVKDIKNADSILLSKDAWQWWQTVARPRLAPWAPVILVQTRWHEADLAGRMIAKQQEDESASLPHYDRWRVINIPAQADHKPENGEVDVLGREPGEYMVSARGRTEEQWEATKAATVARYWTALYQGRPSPDIGDVWLKAWWRRYSTPMWSQQPDGSYTVPDADSMLQSWDFSFKDKASSDYVSGGVWAIIGADAYLIYQVWARLSFTASLDAMLRVSRLFPQAHRKLVEDKANGTAIIDSLKKKLSGVIPVEVGANGKLARAEAVSPFLRAGNVWLPTTDVATQDPQLLWDPESLILEATAFPNAAHDDQVDMVSQALAEIFVGPGGKATMSTARGEIAQRTGSRGIPRGPVNGSTVQRRILERQLQR